MSTSSSWWLDSSSPILVTALVPGLGSTAHAAAVVQPTDMVGSTGGNAVQPTGMVDPKDLNIVQPTGIVRSTGENVVQRADIVGHYGNFTSLTGNVGRNGDLIQATDLVGRDGNLVQPITSVGPKAKHVMQEILIAQTRNGKIVQVVINVFHVYHHD